MSGSISSRIKFKLVSAIGLKISLIKDDLGFFMLSVNSQLLQKNDVPKSLLFVNLNLQSPFLLVVTV